MEFNLPTILVLAVVAIVFFAIIIKGIINRKKGKTSCGCNCEGCALKDKCHTEK